MIRYFLGALLGAFLGFIVHAGDLPDPTLTPGAINPSITLYQVKNTKWGEDKRLVTDTMKQRVVAAYHFDINDCPLVPYKGGMARRLEIDHLISRELGGADDIKNLWPQCYEVIETDKSKQANGAHKKDMLENKLHALVISDDITLEEAQQAIRTDWVAAFNKYVLNAP